MSLSDLQRQSKHSYHSNNLKIILDGNRVTLFKKLVVSWIRFVRYMLDYAHEKTNQMKMLNVMKLAAVKYGIPFLCPALKSPIEKWKGQTASWANFLTTSFHCNIAHHYFQESCTIVYFHLRCAFEYCPKFIRESKLQTKYVTFLSPISNGNLQNADICPITFCLFHAANISAF